jgi:dTDP-4-dehydrorhamnose reductase
VIVITGGTGLFGPYLCEAAAALAPVRVVARHGGEACDLTDRNAVGRLFARLRPRLVVHAAAMTNVDACETAPAVAIRVNELASANVAATLSADAVLVYISTDQVYPDVPGPHREGSEAPVNVYGRSKLAGERATLARERTLVVRTNLFGPSRSAGRQSLSDFLTERLGEREPVTLFRDSWFSPLHMTTLASLVFELAHRNLRGIYNVGCRAGASKAEFGLMIARHLGLPTDTAAVGDSSAITGRAPRPHDLRLDVSRVETALGRVMPTLAEEVSKL